MIQFLSFLSLSKLTRTYILKNVVLSGVNLYETFFLGGRLFLCLVVAVVFLSLFSIPNLGYLAYQNFMAHKNGVSVFSLELLIYILPLKIHSFSKPSLLYSPFPASFASQINNLKIGELTHTSL